MAFELNDKVSQVTKLPCENEPHDYGPADMSASAGQATSRQTCKECKTVRIVVIETATGKVIARCYEYPQPSELKGEPGDKAAM